jgi:adenylate cyclase
VAFKDDVIDGVAGVLSATWDRRDGTKVPTTDTVKLKDGAVNIEAAYLYADLADSSVLAQKEHPTVAGKVIRAYLNAASRIITHEGGEIRSFDGDRVMGVFIGHRARSRAVQAGLGINWALTAVLAPKFKARWGDRAFMSSYMPKHGVGIEYGAAMVVRGGVRDNNDLVSIGAAPNIAAKLSDLRHPSGGVYVSKAVYEGMAAELRPTPAKWWPHEAVKVGGTTVSVFASNWPRVPT